LREAVVLAQVCDLLWVLLVLDLFHDLEPISHLLAVTLFDSGEVGFAGWVFRHKAMVIHVGCISLPVHLENPCSCFDRHSLFEVCAHEHYLDT